MRPPLFRSDVCQTPGRRPLYFGQAGRTDGYHLLVQAVHVQRALHVLPRRHHAQQDGASHHAARGRTRRPAQLDVQRQHRAFRHPRMRVVRGQPQIQGTHGAHGTQRGLHPASRRQPHRGRHDTMGKSGDGRGRNRNPRPDTPLPEHRGRRRTARLPVPGIGDIHCPPQQHRGRGLAPVLQRHARGHRHLLRDAVDVRRRDARTHPGRGLHGLDGSGEGIDVHQTGAPPFPALRRKEQTGVPIDLAAARRAGRPRAAGRAGRHLHLCALRQELP